MFDVRVHGANELARVGRLIKEAGDKDLKREFYRGLNSAVKPLTADVKQHLPDYLPDAYAATLSKQLKIRSRRRLSERNPALYLIGTAKGKSRDRYVGALDKGVLRHPLFGDRTSWFAQRVRPGFWTERLDKGSDKVRHELVEALARIARKITS